MSTKDTREGLLAPHKEKYATGDYIIISGKHWECFDLQEVYIHKKDKDVLEAFLKNENVEIEWYISHNGYPYIWDDFSLDFLRDYDEDCRYRLKARE